MGRWEDARPDSTWAERTRILASYIPVGASVLEFGAWTMELKRHLPPLCTYTPSDLFYRGKGTIVCDLNGPELPIFPKHDVAVFGGVLEYVEDCERLFSHLSTCVDVILASYAASSGGDCVFRRDCQWVNSYTLYELMAMLHRAGFKRSVELTRWKGQPIVWAG